MGYLQRRLQQDHLLLKYSKTTTEKVAFFLSLTVYVLLGLPIFDYLSYYIYCPRLKTYLGSCAGVGGAGRLFSDGMLVEGGADVGRGGVGVRRCGGVGGAGD